MIQLFDPENKFWQFIGKLTDAACMSILWVITCLPIFTVGAATAAFYEFTIHQVRDIEGSVVKSFFTAFRRHFKKATVLWLIELAGFAFFAVDLWAAWGFFLLHGGYIGIALLGFCGCIALIFICSSFYVFPTLAIYDFPLKKLISNSFIMAVGNLPVTLTLAIMTALVCLGIYFISGLFFFWIGLYIFFSSYFIVGVFLKYTDKGQEDAE